MNLKERGVTVGDLIIISVIIISTFFIFSKFKESDKQSNIYFYSNEISNALII